MNQTFRPTFALYRRRVYGAIPALIIVGVLDYFRIHQSLAVYATFWGVIVVGLAVWITLYFTVTRVEASPLSLSIRIPVGLTHTVAEHNLDKAVLVSQYSQSGSASTSPVARLFILDEEGRSVLRWWGNSWTREQMEQLVSTLQLPLETVDERMTPKTVRQRYPRALASIELHPVIWAVTIIVVVIAGAVAYAFLTT